jgi:hypothetical protein
MSTDKQFQLYSHLTKEQADVMLAVLVNLHGERVENCVRPDEFVVTVTKEEFESIPDISRLTIEGNEASGIVTLKLKEVSSDE